MNVNEITAQIDLEIARLQQARQLLAGTATKSSRQPGDAPVKTRTMSPEGRARVAAAQKKRWAAQKKAAKLA